MLDADARQAGIDRFAFAARARVSGHRDLGRHLIVRAGLGRLGLVEQIGLISVGELFRLRRKALMGGQPKLLFEDGDAGCLGGNQLVERLDVGARRGRWWGRIRHVADDS